MLMSQNSRLPSVLWCFRNSKNETQWIYLCHILQRIWWCFILSKDTKPSTSTQPRCFSTPLGPTGLEHRWRRPKGLSSLRTATGAFECWMFGGFIWFLDVFGMIFLLFSTVFLMDVACCCVICGKMIANMFQRLFSEMAVNEMLEALFLSPLCFGCLWRHLKDVVRSTLFACCASKWWDQLVRLRWETCVRPASKSAFVSDGDPVGLLVHQKFDLCLVPSGLLSQPPLIDNFPVNESFQKGFKPSTSFAFAAWSSAASSEEYQMVLDPQQRGVSPSSTGTRYFRQRMTSGLGYKSKSKPKNRLRKYDASGV